MKYFVYYWMKFNCYDMDYHGLYDAKSKEDALDFIDRRKKENAYKNHFKLIEGKEINIK